jgi:hypothetical protein
MRIRTLAMLATLCVAVSGCSSEEADMRKLCDAPQDRLAKHFEIEHKLLAKWTHDNIKNGAVIELLKDMGGRVDPKEVPALLRRRAKKVGIARCRLADSWAKGLAATKATRARP